MVVDKMLTAKDLQEFFSVSKSTVYQLTRRSDFPQGVRFGETRRWPLSQVSTWLEKNMQQQQEKILNGKEVA